MTDDGITRDEFEALQERVNDLEAQVADSPAAGEHPGLDHRDQTVLDYMGENGKLSKRSLVELYTRLTDITNNRTAKQRARVLEQHPAYKEL